MSDRKAFTLVELLVVVAIIALLLAILLPSLKSARGQARSVVCLTNLRTINTGINMYALDNRGFAVPSGIASKSSGGPAPADYYATTGVAMWHAILLGQYTDVQATSTSVTGAIPKQSVWRCPEVTGVATNSVYPHYSHAACYTATGWGQLFANIRVEADWTDRMFRLSQVRSPSKCMTLLDMNAWTPFSHGNSPETSPYYGNPNGVNPDAGWAKDVPLANRNHTMRHPPGNSLGTNMGFVDGHVATITNVPSDSDGFYWLKPLYGGTFVLRPGE